MRTATFGVVGMTCEHCRAAVTRALQGVPGVASAQVDLERGEATVTYDPDTATESAMAAAVEEAGYRLVVR
jgi:copper chaperone